MLTAERLRQEISYDPASGLFFRRRNGAQAGSIHRTLGYIYISIGSVSYLAHRLAWLYVHGEWPRIVDHINGCRADNRIANLRSADNAVNMQNRRGASRHSKSGVLGVCCDRGRWVAHIMVARKRKNLGRYETIEAASDAYITAKRQLHAGCTI